MKDVGGGSAQWAETICHFSFRDAECSQERIPLRGFDRQTLAS
jgi:hypothetical protein